MAFDQEIGTADIREQEYDGKVKGFATAMYKFKQALTISKTSAWTNFFYRETPTALTAKGTRSVKGIPRGADFPQASVVFERVAATIEKYGLEDYIYWEDILSNDVDVKNRTLFRIAEAVVKSVDDENWDVLTESQSPSAIQSFTIGNTYYWDGASAAIFDDLGRAKKLIKEKNYTVKSLLCFISPKDEQSITNYIYEKGAQAPKMGEAAALNGGIGRVNGVDFVVSNSVTASYALVVVPKVCATWKELVPLQTVTEEEKLKGVKIRAAELGVTQLTDPSACVLIMNTQTP